MVERKENQLNLQYFTNYKVVHLIYMFIFVEHELYIIEKQNYKYDFSIVHFSTLPYEIIDIRLAEKIGHLSKYADDPEKMDKLIIEQIDKGSMEWKSRV